MPIGLNSPMGMPGMMNRPMGGGQGFMNRPMGQPGYINQPKAPPRPPTNLGQPRANPSPRTPQQGQPTPAPGFDAYRNMLTQGLDADMQSVLQNRAQLNFDANLRAYQQRMRQEAEAQRTQQRLLNGPFGGAMIGGRGLPFAPRPQQNKPADPSFDTWLRLQQERNRLWGKPPGTIDQKDIPPQFQRYLGLQMYAPMPTQFAQYGNALRGLYG